MASAASERVSTVSIGASDAGGGAALIANINTGAKISNL